MEAGGPFSKKRRSAGLGSLDAAAAAEPTAEDREPPLPGADRLSDLPDAVLGDIVSLLPTREGARTQILASRWRHLWRFAPLNLDLNWLYDNIYHLNAVMSRVLAAHQGPCRRFCAPVYHLVGHRAPIVDAWLRSPTLDNLHELELCSYDHRCSIRLPCPLRMPNLPPKAAFRFSDTLCVATIGECFLPDSITQALHFPKLQKLALERVSISESSLQAMIAACPALECLLIQNCSDFRCVRINSISLRGIGMRAYRNRKELKIGQVIIENAPCLQSLLYVGLTESLHISVISAPKLETLGFLSSDCNSTHPFELTVIQGLHVDSLMTTVHTIKILAVDINALTLDAVIDLMICFPCLERLYIESSGPGQNNLWRRKHRNLATSLDMHLKTIFWRYFWGIKSQVELATFFLQNARVLEFMTLQVYPRYYKEEFFTQQREKLQLDNKASGGARLHFTLDGSHRSLTDFCVHDLDLADPFERRYPYQFRALS